MRKLSWEPRIDPTKRDFVSKSFGGYVCQPAIGWLGLVAACKRRQRRGREPWMVVESGWIQRQRARGDSLWKIAESLSESGVPTAQGGAQWYAATVRHVLLRTS